MFSNFLGIPSILRVYIFDGEGQSFFFFFLSTGTLFPGQSSTRQARRDDRVRSRVTDLRFPTISDKVRARADKKGERGTWQRISRRRMGQSRNFTSNRGLQPSLCVHSPGLLPLQPSYERVVVLTLFARFRTCRPSQKHTPLPGDLPLKD